MSDVIKELKEKLNTIEKMPYFLDRVHVYLEETKDIFAEAIKAIKKIDKDLPSKREEIAQEYVSMSKFFWKEGQAPNAAVDLLLHGCDQFAEWQKQKRQYVSRSTLFSQLTAYYLHVFGDIGYATWWALHTVTESDGGDNTFITRLGYPQEVAEKLRENRSKLQGEIIVQKPRESFTEDIIRDFFINNTQYHYILGGNSDSNAFPICKPYYSLLLNDVTKDYKRNENHERGKALERLASYLFLLIPGCVPRQNVKDVDNTHETDLVILNRHPTSNLATELFGRHILVECKNWSESVGVPEVGYFLHNIHLMHGSFGVLFAREGISGSRNSKDEIEARQLIRRTFHENHTLCVVVTRNDLERLRDENITFRDLLIQLADEFRFGKTNPSKKPEESNMPHSVESDRVDRQASTPPKKSGKKSNVHQSS
jgi:hypothetical protein